MSQEIFQNYLGQSVTRCKSWQHDYWSTCNAMNVVLHAKARAKRGKSPSMSIGIIKNPNHALRIAKMICNADDDLYWPDENSATYQEQRDKLVAVVRGKKDFTEWQQELRSQANELKKVQKSQAEFRKLHPVVRRVRKISVPVSMAHDHSDHEDDGYGWGEYY